MPSGSSSFVVALARQRCLLGGALILAAPHRRAGRIFWLRLWLICLETQRDQRTLRVLKIPSATLQDPLFLVLERLKLGV